MKRLKLGPIKSFSIMGGQTALLFVSNMLLAKKLGAEHFGIYSITFATLSILSEFCTLGGRGTIIRFVSNYETNKQYDKLKGLLIYSHFVGLGMSLFILGAGLIFLHFSANLFSNEIRQSLKIMLILLPFNTIVAIRQFITRGLKMLFRSLVPDAILRPSLFILFIFYFSQNTHLTAAKAFTFYGWATFVSVIVGYLISYKKVNLIVKGCTPVFEWKVWRQSGVPITLASLGQSIARRLDMYILALLLPMSQVGLYSIAIKITMSLNLVQMSIRIWAGPLIASMYAASRIKELQLFLRKMVRISSALIILPTLTLCYFSKQILLLFGSDYVAASNILVILLVAEFLHISFGLGGNIMLMTALDRLYLVVTSACSIIGSCALYWCIHNYGLIGAAYGFFFSVLILNICYAYTIFRKHRLVCFLH